MATMERQRQAPKGTYNQQLRLAEARKAAGMTQDDVCAVLGVTQPTLSRYEDGSLQVSLDKLKLLGEIYKRDFSAALASHPDNEAVLQECVDMLKNARPEMREAAIRAVKGILGGG